MLLGIRGGSKMKVALSDEMKKIDIDTIEEYGIPGVVLMENAGRRVVDVIVGEGFSSGLMVCGTGSNGGDGFVVARYLSNYGINVKIFVVGDRKNISGDSLVNLNICKKLGIEVKDLVYDYDFVKFQDEFNKYDFIVDGIFGTGLNKDVEGIHKRVIHTINNSGKYVYSIDIPSGIGGNDGKIYGDAIIADKTIALQLPKCGNLVYPGAGYNGDLIIRDIGIPKQIIDKHKLTHNLINYDLVKGNFRRRNRNTHKGSYGKVNVIAGSTGMTGAALLTCQSILRTGAGLLKLFIGESLNPIVKISIPEAITVPLQEMRKGVVGIKHIPKIIEQSKDIDALAIGPGCGISSELAEVLRQLIESVECPIIIDADGLNVLAKNLSWLEKKKGDIILTPHPGEMSRLSGHEIDHINENTIEIAKEFSMKWDVITILKGASTVVSMPDGEVYINTNGNPGMATGGSGDVLTGIVTGLIAQGLNAKDASITGVYLHGYTGDKVVEDVGEYGLLAGDLVDALPYVIKDFVESSN